MEQCPHEVDIPCAHSGNGKCLRRSPCEGLMALGVARAAAREGDPVSPDHYKRGRIEIMDFIVDQGWGEDNCKGNIIKYITRAGAKMGEDELTDLRKARWYLDKLIDITERKQ